MGSIKTAEGTCQSPLHTPGWVRWEELFKTEGGKNGLGYSNKKVVVRVFGSTILARRRLFRIYIDIKNKSFFREFLDDSGMYYILPGHRPSK